MAATAVAVFVINNVATTHDNGNDDDDDEMRRHLDWRTYHQQWLQRYDVRSIPHSRRTTIDSRNDITQFTFSIALIILNTVQLLVLVRLALF